MENLTTLLDQTLLGITLNRYLYALLATLVALIGKKLFAYLLTHVREDFVLEIAFPSHTVYLHHADASDLLPQSAGSGPS